MFCSSTKWAILQPKVIEAKQNPMIAKVPKSVNQVKNCWGVTAGQQGWAGALLSPDSEDEDDEEDPEKDSVRSGYR